MGTRLRKKYMSSNLSADSVVTNWLKASSDLYANYKKITSFIVIPEIESNPFNKENQYIGQCPRVLLIELAITMQRELERLLLDMEKTDNLKQVNSNRMIKNLFDHTIVLNELNDQAQIRLDLVKHSSS